MHPNMVETEIISLAKEKLLGVGYGKFDWVDKLVSKNDLLNQKPRLLRKQISNILSISIDDIQVKAFYGFLERYRKKHKIHSDKKEREKNDETTSSSENTSDTAATSWENIKTKPLNKRSDNSNILKPVIYNNEQ